MVSLECSLQNDLLQVSNATQSHTGANALDTLSKVIDTDRSILTREHEWFSSSRFATFAYSLLTPNAFPPCKTRASDSGFDLHLIDVKKTYGSVTLYGTGVSVTAPTGFYFDLVPRSSMIKTGYMLANSVGIIDQGYTGEIMVALIKTDPDAAPLTLPVRLVQLIPRHWYGLRPVLNKMTESDRGEGGFGSTS